jgi:hypothetical protein
MQQKPKDLTMSQAYQLVHGLSDSARALVADAARILPSHAELQRRAAQKERRRQERTHASAGNRTAP